MKGEPPSELERVRLFVELVDEYEALAAALPVEQHKFVLGTSQDSPDYWPRLVRAFALRKFIYPTTTDHVGLNKVIAAIHEIAPAVVSEVNATVGEDIMKAIERGLVGFGIGGGKIVGQGAVAVDLLYGAHLHGDYDRWQRTKAPEQRAHVHGALWRWTSDGERWMREVAKVARHALAIIESESS